MLLKRNLLECLTIISCSGTVICILLNYLTSISPITGIWFTLYILLVFILSVSFSFKFIQWLLRLNKPVKYDLEGLVKEYPYLSFLSKFLPQTSKRAKRKVDECKDYDTNELSVISTVLERKLVSSWYVPYISQEIGFPFACKQMFDQMIGKAFQICNKIETKDVYVDICSIFISHLKEYKKALKRHDKSPNSSIESLYKKSHPIYDVTNKKCQSAEHCTNILRIVLKELVPWELWDTPHSELLVRILSKKLDNFIDNTLSDPVWLNDKLLIILKGKNEVQVDTEKKEVQISEEVEEEPDVVEAPKPETTTIESALSTLITKSTAPILQRPINEDFKEPAQVSKDAANVEEVQVKGTEPVEIKSSPILRQKRGRQGRNEVKIYDRIIEGSVKTWETDIDLQCISLGQDLLASLDGEITLSRLWGQDAEADGSPNPPRSKSPQPLWFGEEDAIDVDVADSSPMKEPSPVKKEHSPKPTDALLKDLQTTVHQAKTKIGDLQVPTTFTNIDVPRKQYSSDEAAGMMEGLLDFGIAGLKKGLRFTGLSDDSQEKSPSHHKEKSGEKVSPPEMVKARPAMVEPKEVMTSTVIQKEENGGNSVPTLVKQHRVTSQDSLPSQPRAIVRGETSAWLAPLADSPEPEYEEAADLSTSIAKLRSLLQQRADTSPSRNDDIWWETAEETRGRTQHHHSSRPVDTATLADEYDMSLERNSSPGQSSNNMQRLDKLFQRTVTGVFNSIKTAVGAEGDEVAPHPLHDWTYVCTSIELSVGGAVARLVGSRRAFTHVDAALDSLDHLAPPPPKKEIVPEDFEEWCAAQGARWCAGAEAAAAAGLGAAHLTQRLATLIFADLAESLINVWLDDLSAWLRKQVFVIFERMSDQTEPTFGREKEKLREFNVEETCAAVMGKIPELYIFGEETLTSAVRLSISSFGHKEVNKDVIFRALDLFALHFKKSAGLRNPSFDVN